MTPPREALSEYTEAQRRLRSAWDAHHRQAPRNVFINSRLALTHLVAAVLFLKGQDPGDDPAPPFLAALGSHLPLERAAAFPDLLDPPELKPLGPVRWDTIDDSARSWLITRRIPRDRAFAHLNAVQEFFNLTVRIIEQTEPGFFPHLNR